MKEKTVENLAALLKKTSEEVNAALESDGLETMINEFKTNNQILSPTDFAKLKENFRKEIVSNLTADEIPDEYKAKAVGWKLEKLENDLKQQYQYDGDFNGLSDLISKIITKTEKPENKEEVQQLKDRIVEIEKEYETKLNEKSKEFDSKIIKDDFQKSLSSVGLDYEDETVTAKQAELLEMSFKGVYKIDRQDGQTVVLKDGEVLKDSKLDPIPLNEVINTHAKNYGFQLKSPDPGGLGGTSSKSKNSLKGISFDEYISSKGIKPNTNEADEAYAEWNAANK